MRLSPVLAGIVAFVGVSYGAACQSSTSTAGLEDVVYEGGTSDEALGAMTALPSKTSPRPLAFTTPTADAKLPAAVIPTFAWGETSGVLDAGTGFFGAPRPSGARTAAWSLARSAIPARWLGGREAHAHGAALNGKAYFLTFSTTENAKALRVFTTATSYKPTSEAWQKLTSAKGTITAKLQSAVFDNNAVAQDGGPYDGTPVSFTVTP